MARRTSALGYPCRLSGGEAEGRPGPPEWVLSGHPGFGCLTEKSRTTKIFIMPKNTNRLLKRFSLGLKWYSATSCKWRKSQSRAMQFYLCDDKFQIYQITKPRICTKWCITLLQNSPKSGLFKQVSLCTNLSSLIWKNKRYVHCTLYNVFADLRKLKIRQSHKRLGPQIYARSTNLKKLFKSANLRICDLRNLFADIDGGQSCFNPPSTFSPVPLSSECV